MKRLILTLVFILSIVMATEHYNPNGRPGTLHAGFKINIDSRAGASTPGHNMFADNTKFSELSMKLSFTNWLTLTMDVAQDYNGHDYPGSMITILYDLDMEYLIQDEWLDRAREVTRWNFGADFHIPLYKLWEK